MVLEQVPEGDWSSVLKMWFQEKKDNALVVKTVSNGRPCIEIFLRTGGFIRAFIDDCTYDAAPFCG